MQIPILGLGDISTRILRKLEGMLAGEFLKVKVYAKGAVEFPEDTFNNFRDQYLAERIMDEFHEQGIQVLVTEEDIGSRDKNYLFGEAEYRGPALVSTHRLDPGFYDKEEDKDLVMRRLKKVTIHQLGRCFGVEDCDNPGCVMQTCSSVKDVDDKSSRFCDECQVEISTKGLPLQ